MKLNNLQFVLLLFAFGSCSQPKELAIPTNDTAQTNWNYEALEIKSINHQDSAKWNLDLLNRDLVNYPTYKKYYQSLPLERLPFPVADYDFAVSSNPFEIEEGNVIFKGVSIGEYVNEETEEIKNKLTLIVLTNNKDAEENTFVESRNAPYLTAEGYFKVSNNTMEWVFAASPDGFATLLLNMKLFDLRFGQTIVIFPQEDHSIRYVQLDEEVDNFSDLELFKKAILSNVRVVQQLNADGNIKN